MKFLTLILLSIALFALNCQAVSNVRYINTMPQFGSANVSAVHSLSNIRSLFSAVSPGAATSYTSIDSLTWNFFTSFTKKVLGGSNQTDLDDGSFYSIFTYQKSAQKIANLVIQDRSTPVLGNHSAIRAINIGWPNYDINVTGVNSNNETVIVFNDIDYAETTDYVLVPPGDYDFSWSTIGYSKRNVEQFNCTICGLNLKKHKSYTYYVMPYVYLVTLDGTISTRNIRSKRAIQKSNALVERLSETENDNANEVENIAPEVVAVKEREVNNM